MVGMADMNTSPVCVVGHKGTPNIGRRDGSFTFVVFAYMGFITKPFPNFSLETRGDNVSL